MEHLYCCPKPHRLIEQSTRVVEQLTLCVGRVEKHGLKRKAKLFIVLLTRVLNQSTMCVGRLATNVLAHEAVLCYCTIYTCQTSTNAACRLICITCINTEHEFVLLYYPHVVQFYRRSASVDERHVCRPPHGPVAASEALRQPIRLVRAARACHVGVVARTNSHTHSRTDRHIHACWELRNSKERFRSALCAHLLLDICPVFANRFLFSESSKCAKLIRTMFLYTAVQPTIVVPNDNWEDEDSVIYFIPQ